MAIKVTFVEDVYQAPNKKHAIVHVHKNASTTTRAMFQGWKRVPKIAKEAKIFAIMQDPMVRWMKGMIQIDKMELGIFDNHTSPISLTHHDIFNNIHFIPLDHPTLTLPEAIWMETGLEVKDVHLHYTMNKVEQASKFEWLRQLENEASPRQRMAELLKWDIRAYNLMKQAWNY